MDPRREQVAGWGQAKMDPLLISPLQGERVSSSLISRFSTPSANLLPTQQSSNEGERRFEPRESQADSLVLSEASIRQAARFVFAANNTSTANAIAPTDGTAVLTNPLRAPTGNIEPYLPQKTVDQIRQQIHALRGGDVHTGEVQSSPTGNALSGVDSASMQISAYLQLIRQLSHDDDSVNRVLDQIAAYLDRGQNQEPSKLDTSFAQALQQQAPGSTSSTSIQVQESTQEIQQVQIAMDTPEGEPQRFLNIQYKGSEVVSISIQIGQQSDPLVFDLNGNGLELSRVEDGVTFAIDGKGVQRKTAFVQGGDAFLALDRDGNGKIDGGQELFGDQNGAIDGFAELARFDENQDGSIDAQDKIFSQLQLYQDQNRDGISQEYELKRLDEL